MTKAYPIIIYPKEGGSYYVEIPDIDRGTQGESLDNAMSMAREALCLWAISEQDEGRAVPEPSSIESIPAPENAVVTLADVDFDAYRRSRNM